MREWPTNVTNSLLLEYSVDFVTKPRLVFGRDGLYDGMNFNLHMNK